MMTRGCNFSSCSNVSFVSGASPDNVNNKKLAALEISPAFTLFLTANTKLSGRLFFISLGRSNDLAVCDFGSVDSYNSDHFSF